jgi:hypothetical protein
VTASRCSRSTGDRAVGTSVSFFSDEGDAWLAAVYVTPAHRGRGLLARMVEPCAAWARERGAEACCSRCTRTTRGRRRAYERLGFVATGATGPYPLGPAAASSSCARAELTAAYRHAWDELAPLARHALRRRRSSRTCSRSSSRPTRSTAASSLAGGVLAPLPAKVRLPHEDEQD